MRGVVLDLGGKRVRKRGTFRPPEAQAERWFYVNIAPETRPDILADVTNVPLSDACADCIICTEVLEHLPNPAACVNETYRLLKPGGVLIISVPFLYPVHADPHDYCRLTDEAIRRLCHSFNSVQVLRMGGYLGTVGMFMELGAAAITGWRPLRGALKRLAVGSARILYALDVRGTWVQHPLLAGFTNGYFVVAVK